MRSEAPNSARVARLEGGLEVRRAAAHERATRLELPGPGVLVVAEALDRRVEPADEDAVRGIGLRVDPAELAARQAQMLDAHLGPRRLGGVRGAARRLLRDPLATRRLAAGPDEVGADAVDHRVLDLDAAPVRRVREPPLCVERTARELHGEVARDRRERLERHVVELEGAVDRGVRLGEEVGGAVEARAPLAEDPGVEAERRGQLALA